MAIAIWLHKAFPKFQPSSSEAVPEISSPPGLSVGALPMLPDVPHPPPGLPLPQYNLGEFIGQHTWPTNIIVSPINQPIEVKIKNTK